MIQQFYFGVSTQTDICIPMFTATLFYKSQNVEVPQVAFSRWMEKQNMVDTYSRILSSL